MVPRPCLALAVVPPSVQDLVQDQPRSLVVDLEVAALRSVAAVQEVQVRKRKAQSLRVAPDLDPQRRVVQDLLSAEDLVQDLLLDVNLVLKSQTSFTLET